jgi:hypothetical protein
MVKGCIMAKNEIEQHEQERIAANNPAKRMDENRGDNDFPGYPHYPKKEDIMDGRSDAERVNVDVENLPNFHNATTPHKLNPGTATERATNSTPTDADMDTDLGIEMGTEADISAEERKMLEDDMYYPTQDEDRLRQARLDDTDMDGEPLNEESFGAGQAETGVDLDMNTDADTTASDAMGQGDEENQYFSLGSAENDNIVEGTP